MNSNTPEISVLMSVYNAEKYLKSSIQSVLNQTFTRFEFIIVNDGSTDNSMNIITSFDDERIKVIDNPQNMGLTLSLNSGLRKARGKYIARLDADDICFENRLYSQYTRMEEQGLLLLGGWAIEVDDEFNTTRILRPLTRCRDLRFKLLFSNSFIHSTIMFRREDAMKLGGYDESYICTQDYDLWSRFSRIGRVGNIPEFLIYLRTTPNSISRMKAGEQKAFADKIAAENKLIIQGGSSELSEIMFLDELYSGNPKIDSDQLVNPATLRFVKLFCRYFGYAENEKVEILSQIYYRYLQWADNALFQKKISVTKLFNSSLVFRNENLKLFIVILIKKILGETISSHVVFFLRWLKVKRATEKRA